ncbi:MAG: hypothetical protein HYV17_04420 [Xanthomonadales bacterium]|nr:hypothetical protein [Xanthomonadales bacterium]
MNSWIEATRGLFVFRRGPADLPYAPGVLLALFVAMIALDAAAARALAGQSGDPLLAVLNNAAALALVLGLLQFAGKPQRFVQTATALLLVRGSLSLLTLLLLAGVLPLPRQPEDLSPGQALRMSLMFPIFVWYIGLRAHVLRHALEIPLLRALGLVLLIAAVEFFIALSLAQAFR